MTSFGNRFQPFWGGQVGGQNRLPKGFFSVFICMSEGKSSKSRFGSHLGRGPVRKNLEKPWFFEHFCSKCHSRSGPLSGPSWGLCWATFGTSNGSQTGPGSAPKMTSKIVRPKEAEIGPRRAPESPQVGLQIGLRPLPGPPGPPAPLRKASGKPPGGLREASGRPPGGLREASGRPPGSLRQLSGSPPSRSPLAPLWA